MAYWLVKSEPDVYSWVQLKKDKRTTWEGVRNYAARNNLRAMKKGEKVFFYHSNKGMEIAGIAEVVKESYQDPSTSDTNWVVVDLKPSVTLKRNISLAEIKKEERLAEMALIKNSRLSVQPVTEDEWDHILKLSGTK